jgi:hypothetical protein
MIDDVNQNNGDRRSMTNVVIGIGMSGHPMLPSGDRLHFWSVAVRLTEEHEDNGVLLEKPPHRYEPNIRESVSWCGARFRRMPKQESPYAYLAD